MHIKIFIYHTTNVIGVMKVRSFTNEKIGFTMGRRSGRDWASGQDEGHVEG